MADVLNTASEASSLPTNAISFNEFYNNYGREKYGADNWHEYDPDYWFAKVGNFFTGDIDTARSAYNAYLKNLDIANETKATQSARAFDTLMANSQYQRAVEDLKKAGLNPWLAAQSSINGASLPSSSKANYDKSNQVQKDKGNDKLKDIALVLLAVAKFIA